MPATKLTSRSSTVVKRDHALITGDGFVNSAIPGWDNCLVNVVIDHAMGADFMQTIITMEAASSIEGKTEETQIFFFMVEGSCSLLLEDNKTVLEKGAYVYIPIGMEYAFKEAKGHTRLLTFHKKYSALNGYDIPSPIIGHANHMAPYEYEGDPDLLMQNLLPDSSNMSFDMAVNIFTYNPGAYLPFVETHVMEHGLMYLQGQGIYRLADDWYPVEKNDCIWMAPYCPQWFGALGKEPAVYIYYKNVNRSPIKP